MAAPKKSDDYYVDVPDGMSKTEMLALVERAAESAGLYISHIGGYSRKKFPDSVHWHFKRDPKERGLLDATFWDVKSLFWLMIRRDARRTGTMSFTHCGSLLRAEVEAISRA